jgi:hypothetical protein
MSLTQAYLDILKEEQPLEEGLIKNALIGTAIAAGALSLYNSNKPTEPTQKSVSGKITKAEPSAMGKSQQVDHIINHYKVRPELANEIVDAAHRHENKVGDFPKAHHLLGLAAVESSFVPSAKSKLRKQPAFGLTQIRPKMHGLTYNDLGSVDSQMEHASAILQKMHHRMKTPEDTLTSYNNGVTATLRGGNGVNYKYAPKVLAAAESFRIKS